MPDPGDYTIPTLKRRLDQMQAAMPTLGIAQIEYRAGIPVPATTSLTTGSATLDVTVIWDEPFPDTSYTITKPQIDIAAITLLGKADARVKSQTAAGCVITVTTTAVISAGQLTLSVLAFHRP